jgi:hypothetical protein
LEGIPETKREEFKDEKIDGDEWFKNCKKLLIQLKNYPELTPSISLARIASCLCSRDCGDSEGTPGELDPKNTLVAKDPMPSRLGLAMLWALCSTY